MTEPQESRTGEYFCSSQHAFIVEDADGKLWAYLSNKSPIPAYDVRGRKLAPHVPEWVVAAAAADRRKWDQHNAKMEHWLDRDKKALEEGRLRSPAELPNPLDFIRAEWRAKAQMKKQLPELCKKDSQGEE